jgi:ABC-type lipoprotein release transport system permease subunit
MPANGQIVVSRVVGVFGDASAVRSADLIVATTAHARRLLAVPDAMATDLAIDLTTMDEAAVITERVGEALPGARVLDRRLLERTYQLTFDARGGLIAALLLPALAALLLISWERLTGLSESERREIGVLKAVGWGTRDVLAARAWESGCIAFFGALSGALGAYAYVFLLGAPGLYGAMLGWSSLYPPLDLAPALDASQLVALLALVVVPFVAISLVPAWRAAMIDPDRAMRGGA